MPHFIPPSGRDFLSFTSNLKKKDNTGNGKEENSKEGFVREVLKRFHVFNFNIKTHPTHPVRHPPLTKGGLQNQNIFFVLTLALSMSIDTQEGIERVGMGFELL